jgi:hypothetical protein
MKAKILFVVLTVILLFNIQNSFSEPRKVLLEFSTGTWCGYCPCGDSIIEHVLLPLYPQSVVLAYHGPANGSDPFSFFNGNGIISLMGYAGYPLLVFDRAMGAPLDYDYNWRDTIIARYTRSPNTVINLSVVSKIYNPSTRELTATIDATALQNLYSNYKINFVIIENNVVYAQTAYAGCTGGPNYVHYWIVRNMVNGAAGDTMGTGVWSQNQIKTKTFTTTLNSAWVADNCELVAFVYKDSSALIRSNVEQSIKKSVPGSLGIEGNIETPSEYKLGQNYPNPFNPITRIQYSIPKRGNISLKIYDVTGNEVMTVFNGITNAGTYNAEIDGTSLSSGVYFYRLIADSFSETKRMVLIK